MAIYAVHNAVLLDESRANLQDLRHVFARVAQVFAEVTREYSLLDNTFQLEVIARWPIVEKRSQQRDQLAMLQPNCNINLKAQ